jgi:dihydroorotase
MAKFYKPQEISDNNLNLINCQIIDPETSYNEFGSITIRDGKIKDFGKNIKIDKNIKTIDCNNKVITPGLIDIQVHFRDPGQTHKEDIISGSKAAISGGVTSVVCQPNTSPTIDNIFVTDYIKYKAMNESYCNIYLYAAITKNLHGSELSELISLANSDNVVGFTDDGLPVMNSYIMRRAFEHAKALNMVIAQHAEDLNISNKGCINEGKISEEIGVRGIPNISESIIVARDIELVRLTGAKYHILHVSAKETLPYIRQAKKEGLPVTAEVSPHHFTLTEEDVLKYDTNAKMNPPLRSKEDKEELIKALCDGTIDAIATDHAPHDINSKDTNIENAAFGITGLETLLPISLELYHNKKMSLSDVLGKLTYKPADIINIKAGRIKKEYVADLCLLDPDMSWEIDITKSYSKSKNSPFHKRKVKGRVLKTIREGKLVYEL